MENIARQMQPGIDGFDKTTSALVGAPFEECAWILHYGVRTPYSCYRELEKAVTVFCDKLEAAQYEHLCV